MAEASTAISLDALPDGVLVSILSKLPLAERLRLSTVCRRWQAAALAPSLLAQVAVTAADSPGGASWLERLRGASTWLVRRAAGSVQHLGIRVDVRVEDDYKVDEADRAEAEALLSGTIAAVGASGSLRVLTINATALSVRLGGWAVALRSLQRLSIVSNEGLGAQVDVSGDLRSLTALQSLCLHGDCTAVTAVAQLPLSLTTLTLGQNEDGESLMVNKTLPEQVAGLTRLQALRLRNTFYRSHQFGPLAALSSTLQSLSLEIDLNLPDCLPRMLALRTLIITDETDFLFGRDQDTNRAIFEATLHQLPHLECLCLELPHAPPTLALPVGPWQRTLWQLAADAQLLAASLPALSEASRLETLIIDGAGKQEQQPAALEVLNWAARRQSLPLLELLIALPDDELPTFAMFHASMAVKGRHSSLDIEAVSLPSTQYCHSLLIG